MKVFGKVKTGRHARKSEVQNAVEGAFGLAGQIVALRNLANMRRTLRA